MANHTRTHIEDDDPRLDAIIAKCMMLEDSGEAVDSEQIKAQHPELSDSLDSYFRNFEFVRMYVNKVRAASAISKSAPIYAAGNAGPPHVDDIPADMPAPRIIGSRYQLLRRLGRGGMGTVHLAYDPQLDRQVAIKFANFFAEQSHEGLRRFRIEARALASIHHSNICQVHDFGEHDGQPYIVMQYLDGLPLSKFIDSTNIQPIRDSVQVVYKLSLALAELHAKKILHRDLKPANIMIVNRTEPVIVDFGLARRNRIRDCRGRGTARHSAVHVATADCRARE